MVEAMVREIFTAENKAPIARDRHVTAFLAMTPWGEVLPQPNSSLRTQSASRGMLSPAKQSPTAWQWLHEITTSPRSTR